MSSEYTTPTIIEYLRPIQWLKRNNVDMPSECIQLFRRSEVIVYGSITLFAYLLGLYIGSM